MLLNSRGGLRTLSIFEWINTGKSGDGGTLISDRLDPLIRSFIESTSAAHGLAVIQVLACTSVGTRKT